MNVKKVLLVKYGEISLRKGNRAFYEHRLMDTIRDNLRDVEGKGRILVKREQGRILVEDEGGDLDITAALTRIKFIFGITGFCVCIKTEERDIEVLKKIAVPFFADAMQDASSFKVETKRSDKRYPLTSWEVSAQIGDAVGTVNPTVRVDLTRPAVTLWVEIRNYVYFYVDSMPGEGGLPYGSSGKGVLLLSGGLDSPIAGYLTARRGVEILPVYFHSPPFVSERAADKVRDLAQVLKQYTGTMSINFIPFTEVQLFLKENVQEEKLTIMLKRAMLRIASAYAKQAKAHCLITGDSIGQVASQTLQSIAAVSSAASHAVLRPLAAMDKQQIINIAREIGTFEISTRPYDDCCTLFVAKYPETKPNTNIIERIEDYLMPGLAPLIDKALEEASLETIL